VHHGSAAYDGAESTTFAVAMAQRGYASLFFLSPHEASTGISGKRTIVAECPCDPLELTVSPQALGSFWLGIAARLSFSSRTQAAPSQSATLALSKILTFMNDGTTVIRRKLLKKCRLKNAVNSESPVFATEPLASH
jgi:hypothetical protein